MKNNIYMNKVEQYINKVNNLVKLQNIHKHYILNILPNNPDKNIIYQITLQEYITEYHLSDSINIYFFHDNNTYKIYIYNIYKIYIEKMIEYYKYNNVLYSSYYNKSITVYNTNYKHLIELINEIYKITRR